MPTDWVVVYSTNQTFEAELVRQMLTDEDIECVTINKQDSSYIFLGDIEVYVPTSDAFRANQLISEFNGE